MIEMDDLRAAVGAGMLTEAQAASLTALADSRRGARETMAPGDEPFELFKGFNEIFIVVGLIILTIGWVGVVSVWAALSELGLRTVLMGAGLFGGGVLCLMSEYFIRRRRMVAPAIALSILFATNAVYGFAGAFAEIFMVAQGDMSSLVAPVIFSIAVMLGYWWRYRVPFALAIIAVGAFVTAILVTATGSGAPRGLRDLFLLSADGAFALTTLGLGAVIFAVAMIFDMSDPHRVTRRAANGFWLHLVAAPALVNTIALSLLENGTPLSKVSLVLFLLVIAVIAIVIDRRSFLIAAVGYTVILSNTVFGGLNAVFTIFAVGALLVLLGAQWERVRRGLMAILPGFIPRHRLPPSV